ncbi:hypothetical protein ACTFBT_04945 [Streptomyces microflavus]|nr:MULTISPECIES: hypothetical protein [Streptomyces]MDX2977432.1 hypothetical protein [Streptomyces sp. NRRL_B-2249]GGX78674.1 hypothetical protein GCM10010298_50040 [Streptomyces microflavus]
MRTMLRALRDAGERRKLLRYCAREVADLPVPDPFSLPALVGAMEAASGRGIRFVALDAPEANLQTACGLRIRGPESTWVIYRPRPTPHQTEHVVLHVLAHEWLDHGTTVPLAEAIQPLPTALQHGVTEAFQGAPVHAHARYRSVDEREAEASAYLIKQRIGRSLESGYDLVSRLEATLSHPLARRGPRPEEVA